MRILLLSDVNSVHTRKWAVSLQEAGNEIALFGFTATHFPWHESHGIQMLAPGSASLPTGAGRISYLKNLPALQRAIRRFRPDILHAHYASSYGLVGALSGFHPFLISVWGSDVNAFPRSFFPGKQVLRFNFRRADAITSTSRSMIPVIRLFTRKEIRIIPFGIDTALFSPVKVNRPFPPDAWVIGIIKSLEPEYGIDRLIRVFHLLTKRLPARKLKLLIVGGGSLEGELRELAGSLGVDSDTLFAGRVPHEEVPYWMNVPDVFVSLSRADSFGVAVLEAGACEKPVVVSDVGGLPEVVADGITGIVVPEDDPEAAVNALVRLAEDPSLVSRLGSGGRSRVMQRYNWTDNVKQMVGLYRESYQMDQGNMEERP